MWSEKLLIFNTLSLQVLGVPFLVGVEQFIIYSMLGWLVESIYMSICNKKITNRGFGVGPFCPIYGFGAVIGTRLLMPFYFHPVLMYIIGAIAATFFEFIVAKLMLRYLNEVWWDYTDKMFNYQGVICLESTIAWGFYGLIIVYKLNPITLRMIEMIPQSIGMVISSVILFLYMLDFVYHVIDALDFNIRENMKEKKQYLIERYWDYFIR